MHASKGGNGGGEGRGGGGSAGGSSSRARDVMRAGYPPDKDDTSGVVAQIRDLRC